MKWKFIIHTALTIIVSAFITITASAQTKLSEHQALQLGTEAYIYGYPLVMMDMTRQVMTNTAAATEMKAPMGQFANVANYPAPSFKDVTTPNADTLYSSAWLNLTKEPYILHIPDMNGRYYLMQKIKNGSYIRKHINFLRCLMNIYLSPK